MYVRTKTVKGRQYYYLVKSVRQGETVMQKCIEYLGSKMPSKKELEVVKKKYEGYPK